MEVVMKRKMMLKACFSDEEIRKINRLRFVLTKILKEFNRVNPRFVAFLQLGFVRSCVHSREDDIRDIIYIVRVKRRNDMDDGFVSMGFFYVVDRDIRDAMSFGNYDLVLDLGEAFDLLFLFLRLVVTFYTA